MLLTPFSSFQKVLVVKLYSFSSKIIISFLIILYIYIALQYLIDIYPFIIFIIIFKLISSNLNNYDFQSQSVSQNCQFSKFLNSKA